MDLENGEPAKAADEPAQKGEAANRDDEAEEVAEGEEEEDAGDGEDEGPGEVCIMAFNTIEMYSGSSYMLSAAWHAMLQLRAIAHPALLFCASSLLKVSKFPYNML